MKHKIGLGLITCDREELFRKALNSIPIPDEFIIINDGKPYSVNSNIKGEYVQHKKNQGVGFSKNEALKYLLEKNCDYIFLMEDDIIIKNNSIYEKYIKAYEVTGLKHMNFAYHGPGNKNEKGEPSPRTTIKYNSEVSISLHSHLAGAFSFYTRDLLLEIGLIDPFYVNAFDHLDHTLMAIKKNYNPPFRWFPDIAESYNLISDQDPTLEKSVIRRNPLFFRFRLLYYRIYFKHKWGNIVENIPDSDESDVLRIMEEIKNKYSLK